MLALGVLIPARHGRQGAVTLRCTGDVASVLRQLSTASGLSLSADPGRARQILIVSLSRVPVAEALKKIAWATYGKWEDRTDGMRLVRNRDDEATTEKAFVERAAKQLREGFDAYGKDVLSVELTERTVAKVVRDRKSAPKPYPYTSPLPNFPAERALARALSVVRPESFALTDLDLWSTYSDQPTPCQFDLGPSSRDILRQFNREMGLWQLASSETLASANPAVRMIVSGSYFRGGTQIALYDANGARVASATEFFRANVDREYVPPEVRAKIPADASVPLSPDSAFFRTESRGNRYEVPKMDLPKRPELLRRLRNPEVNEPLGTFATDVWREAGRLTDRSVVANIDDIFFVPSWSGDPPTLREALRTMWGTSGKAEPGWLLARPFLPSRMERHQVDRAALGKFVRTTTLTNLENMQAAARFAASPGLVTTPAAAIDYAYHVRGQALPSDDWSFLRLYGLLPEIVRQAWMSEQPIPIEGLSPDQRDCLRRWAIAGFHAGDLSDEPTVRFPRWLPDRGFLWAENRATPGFWVRISGGDGTYGKRWESLDGLSLSLYVRQYGNQDWLGGDFLVKEGPKYDLSMYAQFAPGDRTREATIDGPMADDEGYVPWSQAPAPLKARLADEVEKIRKRRHG